MMPHSWISSSFRMLCSALPLIASWICIQKSRPRSHHYRQFFTGSFQLLHCTGAINGGCFACLFVLCISKFVASSYCRPSKSSSITIIILPLLMGRVAHNLSAICERHCIGDVRHYCNGKVSTLWHVTKLCTSYFRFFYLSSPSSHDTHVHSCFTTHLGKHLWIQVCFSPSAASNSVTAHCFERTSVSAVWGSHVVLPSVEWNSCDY